MNFLDWLWNKYTEVRKLPIPNTTYPNWVKRMVKSKKFWILLVILIVFLILARKRGFWIFVVSSIAFLIIWANFSLMVAVISLGIVLFIALIVRIHPQGQSQDNQKSSLPTNFSALRPPQIHNKDLYIPKVDKNFYVPKRPNRWL